MSDAQRHRGATEGQGETAAGHERELLVWEVPAGIAAGAPFSLRVGCKCPAGCPPTGWRFEASDDEGRLVATAAAGTEPWPGTAGLFHAELGLEAPGEVGRYHWRLAAVATAAATAAATGATTAADTDPLAAHPRVETTVSFHVVPEGGCRLRVHAVDRDSGEPVAGARVVVHPFRTRTDAEGVAELVLPAGPYRLFVSGTGLRPFRRDGELDGDLALGIELEADRDPSDAELWT